MYAFRFAFFLGLSSTIFLYSANPIPAQAPQQPAANGAVADADIDSPSTTGAEWRQSIEAALIAGKFDELDQLAEKYRSEKTRTRGGEWRLRDFYGALDAPQQTDKDTRDHLAHLEQWIKERPQSMTARVALATSLHRWAWVARGNGMANTVTPEGWKLFDERIAKAYAVLDEAARLNLPMCPQWYSEMMVVGLAQGWNENQMKVVFDQGIAAYPDYFYLYLQYANYLLPKWDGKPGESAAFARDSADRVGGDAGDDLYFQIATKLIKHGDGGFPVDQMDWERIQRGYQADEAAYGSTRFRRNQMAYMAWKYRDKDFARRQFDRIGDEWSRSVWGKRQLFDRARDWAQSHAS